MSLDQEINQAYEWFQENDEDSGKQGANLFFGYCIMYRFELALEFVGVDEPRREFSPNPSRDMPSLDTVLANYAKHELTSEVAKGLIEALEGQARAYLTERGFYPPKYLPVETFDLDIKLRFLNETFDGDQFELDLDLPL